MSHVALKVLSVAAAVGLALAGPPAFAAYFMVSAGRTDSPITWNPLETENLQPVMSLEVDFSDQQISPHVLVGGTIKTLTRTFESLQRAAAFGSDSSRMGPADPALLGRGVEPMAFAEANARATCFLDADPCPAGFLHAAAAAAVASVNHRVVQRAAPDIADPVAQEILDELLQIPVRLDYQLGTGVSAPAGQAVARLMVLKDNLTIYSRMDCGSQASGGRLCTSFSGESGTWSDVLQRSTVDREVNYTIYASAVVQLGTQLVGEGSGVAVADPFLYVDPDWAYAPYFVVQQESLEQPGQWIEVSRDWRQAVPEPTGGALVLAALGIAALHRGSRRRAPRDAVRPVVS